MAGSEFRAPSAIGPSDEPAHLEEPAHLDEPAHLEEPAHLDEPAHRQPAVPPRRPPPMRVVTKGWWRLEEGRADIAALVEADRDENARPPERRRNE